MTHDVIIEFLLKMLQKRDMKEKLELRNFLG